MYCAYFEKWNLVVNKFNLLCKTVLIKVISRTRTFHINAVFKLIFLFLKTESVRCCLCANKSPGQTSKEFESFSFF